MNECGSPGFRIFTVNVFKGLISRNIGPSALEKVSFKIPVLRCVNRRSIGSIHQSNSRQHAAHASLTLDLPP